MKCLVDYLERADDLPLAQEHLSLPSESRQTDFDICRLKLAPEDDRGPEERGKRRLSVYTNIKMLSPLRKVKYGLFVMPVVTPP